MGTLHYFLGIEVIQAPTRLILSQAKYAQELLLKAGMDTCRPCASPSSLKPFVTTSDHSFSSPEFYKTIVGSLKYLTFTRPDLSNVVNVVCQHMHHTLENHFTAMKRTLRYVKGTLNQSLHFTKGSLHLNAFSDADWLRMPWIEGLLVRIVYFWDLIVSIGQLRNNTL